MQVNLWFNQKLERMMKKIGIVLSGGGVRGVAHIGLLKALHNNGIKPDYIAGASAGAVIGALYANDFNADEMLRFFKKTPIFSFSNYSAKKPGLLDSDRYRRFFEEYFPEDDFSALKRSLFVATTDIVHAKTRIFFNGELIRPLLASAALPPIFTPIEIDGNLYADGGIMNNFPVEPLIQRCDIIIGSFVNPIKRIKKNHLINSMRVFQRAYELRFLANSQAKFKHCDVLFMPNSLYKYGIFDTSQIDNIFNIGYQTALTQMDKIFAILNASEDGIATHLESAFSEN